MKTNNNAYPTSTKEEVYNALNQLNNKLGDLLEKKLSGPTSEEQVARILDYRDELDKVLKKYGESKEDWLTPKNSIVLKKILKDSAIQDGELELKINQLTTKIWTEYSVEGIEADDDVSEIIDDEADDEELEAALIGTSNDESSSRRQAFIVRVDELLHFINQLINKEPSLIDLYMPYTPVLNTIRNTLPDTYSNEQLHSLQAMQKDKQLNTAVREELLILIDIYNEIKRDGINEQRAHDLETTSTVSTQQTCTDEAWAEKSNKSKSESEATELPLAKKHKAKERDKEETSSETKTGPTAHGKLIPLAEVMSQHRQKLHNALTRSDVNQPPSLTSPEEDNPTYDHPDNKSFNANSG